MKRLRNRKQKRQHLREQKELKNKNDMPLGVILVACFIWQGGESIEHQKGR